jgi:hypothetical protein
MALSVLTDLPPDSLGIGWDEHRIRFDFEASSMMVLAGFASRKCRTFKRPFSWGAAIQQESIEAAEAKYIVVSTEGVCVSTHKGLRYVCGNNIFTELKSIPLARGILLSGLTNSFSSRSGLAASRFNQTIGN